MKRIGVFAFVLLFVIISISFVSALEIQIDKDDFGQGQNFLATLSGNILENINIENVGFYKGHVQIPMTFDMIKFDEVYYIYAVLPYTEGNYSLKIKDVYYKENNNIQTRDIEKMFSVGESVGDFNVKPGFVRVKDDFEITITNNLNSDLDVNYILKNTSYSESIGLQSSKKIMVSIGEVDEAGLEFLDISSESLEYEMPVYILEAKPQEEDGPTTTTNRTVNGTVVKREKLRFSINNITNVLNKDKVLIHFLILSNLGDEDAENVEISVSPELEDYVTLTKTKIASLKVNEGVLINMTAKFNVVGDFTGLITAESENSLNDIYLSFSVGENVVPSSSVGSEQTCSQLKGKICPVNCYGEYIAASDGLCCMGSCEEVDDGEGRNWTAIIIVVGLLVVIGGFVLYKLKQPKKTARDILNKKEKSYSERFEKKGSLSKN